MTPETSRQQKDKKDQAARRKEERNLKKAGLLRPHLEFRERWGKYSWKVKYRGKYANDRPKHVEIGLYDTVKKGDIATLSNLAKGATEYRWTVDNIYNWKRGEPAHFTVANGSTDRLESFAWHAPRQDQRETR